MRARGVMPGGSRRNLEWGTEFFDSGEHPRPCTNCSSPTLRPRADWSSASIPANVARVLAELAAAGHTAARIGTATTGTPGIVLR